MKTPKSLCYGITNKTSDGQYVLFADYDSVYFSVVLKELDDLIKANPDVFTNFAIFESSESILTKEGALGSYHVVNFSKMPYHEMRECLSRLSVDDDFYRLPEKTAYRCNTLRISPKFKYSKNNANVVLKDSPRFICFYPTEKNIQPIKNKVSSAHKLVYELVCNMPLLPVLTNKEDGLKGIDIKKYYSLRG